MKVKYLFFLFSILFLMNCKKEGTQPPPLPPPSKSNNLNISFLLDLSDRIDPDKNPNPTMEYYQRDVQYIQSVQKAFINHIKYKKIIQLNDQMQVFFDPEPQNPEINKLSQELKINFDKNTNKEKIKTVERNFSEIPPKIYQLALQDQQFVGSDIWRFFKNKVNDYCVKDNHRNILVIMTDGYMYHENSKFVEGNKSSYITPEYIRAKGLTNANFTEKIDKEGFGFIPATNNLQNLEVLVLGINPSKNNPYEEDIIKLYWQNWLKEMGVKKFDIKTADLPTNLDDVIGKFVAE